ncbi:PilW family protein [Rhodoferax sp.]|uniref:PilW family protein n=1 Tax=Rhodoferax sp. TaxID=50421 RepID=UPI0025D702F9|nr:PilW family protein [Rhodoferax sp.]
MKSTPRPRIKQQGLTLVELLVAMVISTIIAIAAIASLIVSRQGFTAVDASSQLRDNGRFATDFIQRIGVQTGFKDLQYAAKVRSMNNIGITKNPAPNIFGFNNAIPSASDPLNTSTSRTSTTAVGYGSDALILRYQTVETYPGSGVSDNSIIDCFGNASITPPTDIDDYVTSIFYVDVNAANGEPSLMCLNGPGVAQPIIQGVENFQVLYGVDGVTANTASTATQTYVANRYLRADQMTVAADPVATNNNWRRVRSIRIGMVLRGPLGSAQTTPNPAPTYYPFGVAANSTGGIGSAMSSTNDAGTIFTPAADNRLRQTVTFTIHLRNDQGL